MKILLVASLKNIQSFDEIRLTKIYNHISKFAKKIGLIKSLTPNKFNKNPNGVLLNGFNKIEEDHWDIIIVNSFQNLLKTSKRIKNKPIIYLSINNKKEQQCYNLSNLQKIIVTDLVFDPSFWGFSPEFVYFANISPYRIGNWTRQELPINLNPLGNILFFITEEDRNLKLARIVIRALNFFPLAELTIIGSKTDTELLMPIANQNIYFATNNFDIENLLKKTDLVIASGHEAIFSVIKGIKTIVLGPKGFGGLVTESNIHDFIKIKFGGRIGGVLGELIPIELLLYEIQYALNLLDEKPLRQDLSIFQDYLYNEIERWELELEQTLKSVYKVNYLVTIKRIEKLLIKASQSIVLQDSGKGDLFITDQNTGKQLGVLEKDEISIFKSCIPETSVSSILDSHKNFSHDEIIDFIIELWFNKIIHLRIPD